MPEGVKSLPEGTVILLSTVQRDVSGQHFFHVAARADARAFGQRAGVCARRLGTRQRRGRRIGGGPGRPWNARAGQLALRVLGGADPEKVPIEVATKGTPMVDWRALQRWGIKESHVPADGDHSLPAGDVVGRA
jgi:hypothetical protein